MGPTNVSEAPPETIRGKFGASIERNAIHGSDAPETAAVELAFFFSRLELDR
jgi:nucleoside-diphosphate kinase